MDAAFHLCLWEGRGGKLEPCLGHRELSLEILRNVLYFKFTSCLMSFGSGHILPLPRSLCFSVLSLMFPRAPFQTNALLLSKLEGISEMFGVVLTHHPPSTPLLGVGAEAKR